MRLGRALRQRQPATQLTVAQRAVASLRKFGTNAHVYLPGVGVLNGLTVGNYSDSARTSLSAVDVVVGGVTDQFGTIHVTQATTANKPLLRRGLVNLTTHSAALNNAAWQTQLHPAVTLNSAAGVLGELTAATLVYSVQNQGNSTAVYYLAGPYTYVFTARVASGTRTLSAYTASGVKLFDQVITATWTTYYINCTQAAPDYVNFLQDRGTNGFVDVYIEGPIGIFAGTLTSTQVVTEGGVPVTTTAAGSNSAAGKFSWSFDGSNDSLALGSLPFQMSDDHCVIIGASVATIASGSKPLVSCYGTTIRRCAQLSVDTATLKATWTDDAATAGTSPTGTVVEAGTPFVATARKVGNAKELRKNGVSINTSSTAAGTTTLTASTISADGTNSTPSSIGPVILIKGTVPDAELLVLERWVASLTPNGPTL